MSDDDALSLARSLQLQWFGKARAERITELKLNGKPISVTENGDFEEPYLLAEGSNHLILEARDARGRTTQKMLEIVYTAKKTP